MCCGIVALGFLQRQALSTALLLFAISAEKRWQQGLWLLLASLFHVSALPLGLLFIYFKKQHLTGQHALLCVLMALCALFFYPIIDIIQHQAVFFPIHNKIAFYAHPHHIDKVKVFNTALALLPILYMSLPMLWSQKRMTHGWRGLIFIIAFVYLVFFCIPLLSIRLTLISYLMGGFLVFQSAHYLDKKAFNCLFWFIYSSTALYVIFGYEPASSDFWLRFDRFGLSPFYYLF